MNSRNAVMREVLMFPADCSRRTGISLISTFNKLAGVGLCVLKAGKRTLVCCSENILLMQH